MFLVPGNCEKSLKISSQGSACMYSDCNQMKADCECLGFSLDLLDMGGFVPHMRGTKC